LPAQLRADENFKNSAASIPAFAGSAIPIFVKLARPPTATTVKANKPLGREPTLFNDVIASAFLDVVRGGAAALRQTPLLCA